jgi:replication factor C subunit 3/5
MAAMEVEEPTVGSAATATGGASLPWVEKYRPSELGDLVSHTEIIATLQKLMSGGQLPNLLFYGPPGTGKTSTVLACARQLYGSSTQSMVLELNASDDRGIDVVRNQIQSFASTRLMFNKGAKLVILDECDAMTNDAQFALRRIIEKYVKNVRFCLICNYVGKIITALQSRCTKFRFGPLTIDQMQGRLEDVIAEEKVNTTPDGVQALLKLAEGDMRRTLNVLQSASMSYDVVNEDNVYQCCGAPLPREMDEIVQSLLNDDFPTCFARVRKMMVEQGYAMVDVLREVHLRTVDMDFPPEVLGFLFEQLADVEHRLAHATNERLQLSSMIGAFQRIRNQVADMAQ